MPLILTPENLKDRPELLTLFSNFFRLARKHNQSERFELPDHQSDPRYGDIVRLLTENKLGDVFKLCTDANVLDQIALNALYRQQIDLETYITFNLMLSIHQDIGIISCSQEQVTLPKNSKSTTQLTYESLELSHNAWQTNFTIILREHPTLSINHDLTITTFCIHVNADHVDKTFFDDYENLKLLMPLMVWYQQDNQYYLQLPDMHLLSVLLDSLKLKPHYRLGFTPKTTIGDEFPNNERTLSLPPISIPIGFYKQLHFTDPTKLRAMVFAHDFSHIGFFMAQQTKLVSHHIYQLFLTASKLLRLPHVTDSDYFYAVLDSNTELPPYQPKSEELPYRLTHFLNATSSYVSLTSHQIESRPIDIRQTYPDFLPFCMMILHRHDDDHALVNMVHTVFRRADDWHNIIRKYHAMLLSCGDLFPYVALILCKEYDAALSMAERCHYTIGEFREAQAIINYGHYQAHIETKHTEDRAEALTNHPLTQIPGPPRK